MKRKRAMSTIASNVAFVACIIVILLASLFAFSAILPLGGAVISRNSANSGTSVSNTYDNATCTTSTCITYVVQSGDSLYSIGQKFNVNEFEIAAINNIQPPYVIIVGEKLLIPVNSTATNSTST